MRIAVATILLATCIPAVPVNGCDAEEIEFSTEWPTCDLPPTQTPDNWQSTADPNQLVSFWLPPGFEPIDIDRHDLRPHGGAAWAGNGMEVYVHYGQWGWNSFEVAVGDSAYNTSIGDSQARFVYIVSSSPREMSAWFPIKGHSALVTIRFSDESLEPTAYKIVGSMRPGNHGKE